MTILPFEIKHPPFIQRKKMALAYVRKQKALAIKHKLTYVNGSALGLSHNQLLARQELIERATLRAGTGDLLSDNLCECHYFYSMFTRIKPEHIYPQLPFFVYSTGGDVPFWYEVGTKLIEERGMYYVSSDRCQQVKVDGGVINVAVRTSTLDKLPSLKTLIGNY